MVRAHADTSPMHQKVLDCLLDCKKPSDDMKGRKPGEKMGGREERMDTTEMENTWKELDKFVLISLINVFTILPSIEGIYGLCIDTLL